MFNRSLGAKLAGCLTAAGILAGGLLPGGIARAAHPNGLQTVTLGTTPLVSSTPIFLAKDLGFWQRQGLNVNLQITAAADPINIETASSQLDVGATGITAGLANLWNSGELLYIVADKGRIWPGQKFEALLVSNKAWNEGVRSLADLKGKRFGNTTAGSTFDYILGTLLQRQHLSLKDINDVPLTTVPNMAAAVESGQVDAAIVPQPGAAAAMKAGAHLLLWVDAKVKSDLLVIAFSPRFMKEHSLAVRFLKGYIQALRYYHRYVYKHHDLSNPKLSRALDIVNKYTKAPQAGIPDQLIYVNPGGKVDAKSIQQQFNFYTKNGFEQKNVQAKKLIDERLLNQALKQLGKKSGKKRT